MRRPGIHFRLLVAALLLISAATFTLSAIGINIFREFIGNKFKDNISFAARYLATNCEVGILVDDKSWLKRLARNLLLEEEDISRITISDADGKILVDISKDVSGFSAVVEMPVIPKKPLDVNKLFSPSALNVLSGKLSENSIGKVSVTYSTRSIDRLMDIITQRFIWFSAGLAGIASLVFYFISHSIVSQVTRLAEAAQNVAEGDFDLRADPGSLPETRRLALAFNAMLDSIDESRAALAEADKEMMRQGFLAEMGKFSLIIAHEIKNPLGIIKASADVLRKRRGGATDQTMLEYIDDEVKRLDRLVEHFLVFARPVRPSFRTVDLNGLIKETVDRFKIQKNTAFDNIRTDIPFEKCDVQADPDLLSRALGNIIKNGCIAAEGKEGIVLVRAFCKDNTWIVEISDRGEGIPTENMDKIFEPFFTTRSKGSGLGLPFASQVIRAHGGEIIAENRPEGGALFRVKLKIGVESQGQA